ncbi:MAG: hypothetical protein A2X84_07560 [Desulfuromonadaceae bacterium GWC2_58_13]|nr:MAG: hypothetical protein A2X84_07560 [Desulfuromonadaceae bacterium GWC2_58_13]
MTQLALTKQQHQVLSEVLETTLSDLSMEISDTDLKDYRDQLKQRREALASILEALKQGH